MFTMSANDYDDWAHGGSTWAGRQGTQPEGYATTDCKVAQALACVRVESGKMFTRSANDYDDWVHGGLRWEGRQRTQPEGYATGRASEDTV